MTKEEYIKRKDALKYQMQLLNEAYIEANKPCEVGAKVSVLDGNKRVMGIAEGFRVDYSNEVIIIAKKLKVDGTISNCDLHIFLDSDIKYIHD